MILLHQAISKPKQKNNNKQTPTLGLFLPVKKVGNLTMGGGGGGGGGRIKSLPAVHLHITFNSEGPGSSRSKQQQ